MPNSYLRVKRPDGLELSIDLIELETAFDDDTAEYYFDAQSGRIVSHLKPDPFGYGDLEEDDEDETSEDAEIEPEWLPIDRISSRERFGWMEEFTTTVHSITAQTALRRALSLKKPFRHFTDALMEYPGVRQQWFRFEDMKRKEYAVDFIQDLDWQVLEIVDDRPVKPVAEQEADAAGRLNPTAKERQWILRGAAEIATKGGRSQLALLLKESKDKNLLKHGLNRSEAYGKLSFLTIEEIENRIDHLIRRDELRVEFFGDLPLVVMTNSSWEEVRPWANAQEFRRAAAVSGRELDDILLRWRNLPRSEQLHCWTVSRPSIASPLTASFRLGIPLRARKCAPVSRRSFTHCNGKSISDEFRHFIQQASFDKRTVRELGGMLPEPGELDRLLEQLSAEYAGNEFIFLVVAALAAGANDRCEAPRARRRATLRRGQAGRNRIEFPRNFDQRLNALPKPIGAAALVALGRMASGEPASFADNKRLKACPSVTRSRFGHYHLLFRLRPSTIEVLDLIPRGDLERRVKVLASQYD